MGRCRPLFPGPIRTEALADGMTPAVDKKAGPAKGPAPVISDQNVNVFVSIHSWTGAMRADAQV